MKLSGLIKSVETLSQSGSGDPDISGLAYDSRKVKPGWLFIAVPGHNTDGVQFITEALSNGAVAVVSENKLELGSGVTSIQVQHARRAMAELAQAFYGDPSSGMHKVGVTGTNGKTTTAYLIRDILKDGGFLPGLLGTVAYEVGERTIPASRTTPEAPDLHSMFKQMKDAGCDAVVMEVSSHAISLDRVHGIKFNTTVFTNLTQDHLDYHEDMASYFKVKATLLESMSDQPGRAAVINLDDPWGAKLIEEGRVQAQVITYGFHKQAMVCASNAEVTGGGTSFDVTTPWGKAHIKMKLLGRFNIHNALAAISVGGLSGISLERMKSSLVHVRAIPGRLELVQNRKGRQVFVDYAHTDDALKNVLTTLREVCKGKLIVVFGCGGNRDQGKRFLMGQVAAKLADYSYVTSDNPRDEEPGTIAGAIVKGFSNQETFEVVLDRRKAIEKAIHNMGRKDVLLIAGKGHESYQEMKGTIVPFDDCETVREILG